MQASSQNLEDQDVYRRLAEDWLTDAIDEEVTELFLQTRYDLTKAELKDVLLRATREGWAERKKGYGWRFLPVAKTPKAFEQIYRLRMTIEPAAVLEPTFAPDRKRLRELRDEQERLLETDVEKLRVERLLNTGSDFHERSHRTVRQPVLPYVAGAGQSHAPPSRIPGETGRGQALFAMQAAHRNH